MKGTIVLLLAGLAALSGCVSGRGDEGVSASPILTSRQDCLRDGNTWNDKLGVCEARRTR